MAKARAKTKPKRAVVEPIVLGATGMRQPTFVIALAVSDDGTKVATGDAGGNVRVFDAPTGACMYEVRWQARDAGGRHGIQKLVFSPDGAVIAALTGIGGHGHLCAGHLATGATWFETATEYESIAYSPDGGRIAAITRGGLELVNARDGTSMQKLALPKGCYAKTDVIWSGALIVAKYYDQETTLNTSVAVIDGDTFELVARHDTGVELVCAELAFGRDGKVFAVAEVAPHDAKTRDVRVVIVDPISGHTTVREVEGDLGSTKTTPALVPGLRAAQLETSRSGARVLIGVDETAVLRTLPAAARYVAASADGAMIAAARGVALQLFDAAWNPTSSAPGLSSTVTAVGFRDDAVITCDATGVRTWGLDGTQRAALELGEAIALADAAAVIVRDGRTIVVDLPSGRARPGGLDAEHRGGTVSRDGSLLATRDYTNAKGRVLVWSLATGALVHDIDAHAGHGIYGITFSADAALVASGVWTGQVAVHEVATGKRVMTYNASRGWGQQAFSFSADGTLLACGDQARTVRIWTFPEGKVVHILQHQRKVISATAFSPDGALLASCDEATVRLWNVGAGEPAGIARVGASCLAFSPDGTKLAAGGDGVAHIFDVASLISSPAGKRRPRRS